MRIPFTKAHGARNDFLLSWHEQAAVPDYAAAARAICDRHTGVGADGWLLVGQEAGLPWIRLLNSDGSEAEISGNGTRCAAAFLIDAGVSGAEVSIRTGAGVKRLRLLERSGPRFLFEMNMGRPKVAPERLRYRLELSAGVADATILDVGNPQCAVFVEGFDFDWRAMGAEIERHPLFPNRTNVSFVRVVDRHTLEVRFFERGAGETMSSGTGSTGAMAAAVLRGAAESPVTVLTPAGRLELRWESGEIYLTGPAEIVATGEFLFQE
jgi:diaminopimelate epimerase